FAHLESDRVIERSPFAGIKAPRATMTAGDLKSLKVLREEVAEMVRPADERSVDFRAGLVTLFPLFFDGEMDVARISEFTRTPAEEVSVYVSRLRDNRIWTPDNGIEFDGSL